MIVQFVHGIDSRYLSRGEENAEDLSEFLQLVSLYLLASVIYDVMILYSSS